MKVLISLACLLASLVLNAQKPTLLTNQVGYEADKPKRAVLLDAPAAVSPAFLLIDDSSRKVVYKGKLVYAGPVQKWKRWIFRTLDFSEFSQPGRYRLQVNLPQGAVFSHPFVIGKNVLEKATLSDVIYYFKGQRSAGLIDKADHHLFLPASLQTPPGVGPAISDTLDLHGGWYDATGDYGKHLSHLSFSAYFNPQQIPLVVWSLIKSNELLASRSGTDFRQFMRRINDEAAYGADYLYRVHVKGGSFYRSVGAPGAAKAPQDRVVSPEQQSYRIKQSKDQSFGGDRVVNDWRSYESSYRSGGGMAIAALAMASAAGLNGDYTPAQYLQAAEEAFAFLEKENKLLTNDGKENILDDYCGLSAATELLKVTHRESYKIVAEKRAQNLLSRLVPAGYWRADDADRPFFHPSDAGLPLVSLLYYYPYAFSSTQSAIRAAARRSLSYEWKVSHEVVNPFGYSRQLVQDTLGHRRTAFFFPQGSEASPWWQGEDARLSSMSAAARLAIPLFADDAKFSDTLQTFALDQLNWVLGLNPYDASMLQGTGYNNPTYGFFGTFEYTNAPGGIVNGITSGLDDEEGIDFNLSYAKTGKDYDWRWAEQWLPHTAWYLLAVSAGQPLTPSLPLRNGVIDYQRSYKTRPALSLTSGTAGFTIPVSARQQHAFYIKYDWTLTQKDGKYELRLWHFYEKGIDPSVTNEYSKIEYRWWDFWHGHPWRAEDEHLFGALDSTVKSILDHPEMLAGLDRLEPTPSVHPYAGIATGVGGRVALAGAQGRGTRILPAGMRGAGAQGLQTGARTAPRFNALVLYENGGHHIAYSQRARQWLDRLAADSNFAISYVNHTDSIDDAFLDRYQLIIQLDYVPYGWKASAMQAFENYIRQGKGGWVGFHHASLLGDFDGYSMWPWFDSFMGGIRWKNYIPAFARGTVHVEDHRHPVLRGIPDSFVVQKEEWYTYDKSPRPNVHVLAYVDEGSYQPDTAIKMGDHPVIWTNDKVAARNVYIFMGHDPVLFDDAVYKRIFSNSIFWAAGRRANVSGHADGGVRKVSAPKKFRALAFYSNIVEPDHRAFARDIIRFYSDLAAKKGFVFDTTSNWDHTSAQLSQYQLVLWLNDFPHTEDQRSAFQHYIEQGGAWLGFHVSGYNDKDTHWPWFVHFFGDAVFYNNNWPPLPAKLIVEDSQHPATHRLPARYAAPINEWYGWAPNPRQNNDVHVLVSLDTANYPLGKKDVIRSGDIPVVWTNTKYKMLYMNMGHGDLILSDETQNRLFEDAILWLGNGGGAHP